MSKICLCTAFESSNHNTSNMKCALNFNYDKVLCCRRCCIILHTRTVKFKLTDDETARVIFSFVRMIYTNLHILPFWICFMVSFVETEVLIFRVNWHIDKLSSSILAPKHLCRWKEQIEWKVSRWARERELRKCIHWNYYKTFINFVHRYSSCSDPKFRHNITRVGGDFFCCYAIYMHGG